MRSLCLPIILFLAAGLGARGADLPLPATTPGHLMLPQQHQYQRVLRAFLATLTEADLDPGVAAEVTVQPDTYDVEDQYRSYLMTLMVQPCVGTKRGRPSVSAPARLFLLSTIEGAEAITAPPAWPETLMAFVQWAYPGNPYHDNRALKLRCFVTAAVDLMMLDKHLEEHANFRRADWFAYQLVYLGSPYPGFRDLLPSAVQQAYAAGVRKLAQGVLDWGPKGEERSMDMITPIALWYSAGVVDDPTFTEAVEARARMLFSDPRHFHPAGYFIERGGLDLGFGGMTNYFAAWAALATDWPFAQEAVAKVYRLRAHLILPEPDGRHTSPSAFNNRLGSPANADQWQWDGARDLAAAMVTDEALCQVPRLPSAETLAAAAGKRAEVFAWHIRETPRVDGIYIKPEEIEPYPWGWRMWKTWDFSASVNPGYSFYKRAHFAHRAELEQTGSPLLQLPCQRSESFVRDFDRAFVIARQPDYGVILHTGAVGNQHPEDGLFQFKGPLGFGGGQLSAFWTPRTGAVILGRRAGMDWEQTWDKLENWQLWPIHAVTGTVGGGGVFSSARIVAPEVTVVGIGTPATTVTVHGVMPTADPFLGPALAGRLDYQRVFTISAGKLHVQTTITPDGKDALSSLWETIPVFHREVVPQGAVQDPSVATTIELRAGNDWQAASNAATAGVTQVRLSRFSGAALVTFDQPQTVQLSPAEWTDARMTRAVCRNLMISLATTGQAAVGYTVAPLP